MAAAPEFVLVSFNIGKGGSEIVQKMSHPYLLDDMKRVLHQIAKILNTADVVALQEVDRFKSRSRGIDEPKEIVTELQATTNRPWKHYFFKSISSGKAEYGSAILTHLQSQKDKNWELGKSLNNQNSENRVAIAVNCYLQNQTGHTFWIINVHLGLSREDQLYQLERLKKIIDTTAPDKPIILCGDFNIIENHSQIRGYQGISYDELISILNTNSTSTARTFIDLGPRNGITFPRANGRGRKPDYIFFSNPQNSGLADDCKVEIIEASDCSDHHVLKATFRCR